HKSLLIFIYCLIIIVATPCWLLVLSVIININE
ncbi:hypothetical protein AEW10_24895, partial [Salmonella enterica subsp. enterica serovar Typhimurium var. 5-]